MIDSPLLLQPTWVLQSASADRFKPIYLNDTVQPLAQASRALVEPGLLAWMQRDHRLARQRWAEAMAIHRQDLLLHRVVNHHLPALLPDTPATLDPPPAASRIAVVIPGELRSLERSRHFLSGISQHADLFICTNKGSAAVARTLTTEVAVIDPEPALPVESMHQWHKLSFALKMIRARERCNGFRYTHILKLRSDYYHVSPRSLLLEVAAADGLIGASDKVFGGQRDLMLLFEGFYQAIFGWFDQREQSYWPINIEPILRSDENSKWYGMIFPSCLVGHPSSVEALRAVLEEGGEELARALLLWRAEHNLTGDAGTYRFMEGHPRFASEISFARFLNFNGIASHCTPGMLGFLRADRLADT